MLNQRLKSESGFTLVELAIVMIIIGLLIGGVLKGQQLITNAQVAAQVAQFKAIDAAATSFKDMYNGVPGDLLNPATRLASCATSPTCNAAAGNGDGKLSAAPGDTPSKETQAYFTDLALANLLTGIVPTTAVASCKAWGGCYPVGKISSTGIMAGYTGGNAALTNLVSAAAADVRGGTWLTLNNNPDDKMDANGSITPNVAARIDTKVDDGAGNTGTVLSAGAAACEGATAGVYDETKDGKTCSLYIQIQN